MAGRSQQSPETPKGVDLGDSESPPHLRMGLLSNFANIGEITLWSRIAVESGAASGGPSLIAEMTLL